MTLGTTRWIAPGLRAALALACALHVAPARADKPTGDDEAGAPAALPAAPPAPEATDPELQSDDPDRRLRAEWRQKARAANGRVAAAELRLRNAEDAYTQMRTRNHPRGEARADVMKELDDAKAELAAALRERDALEDLARRNDVPASWIEPD